MPHTTCQMSVTCRQIHRKIAFPIYAPPTITVIKWKNKGNSHKHTLCKTLKIIHRKDTQTKIHSLFLLRRETKKYFYMRKTITGQYFGLTQLFVRKGRKEEAADI